MPLASTLAIIVSSLLLDFQDYLSLSNIFYHRYPIFLLENLQGVLQWGLEQRFGFYNAGRCHQALDNLAPDGVYFNFPHAVAEAA
jgi:hypothetical protein